jgi:hypothetical protein
MNPDYFPCWEPSFVAVNAKAWYLREQAKELGSRYTDSQRLGTSSISMLTGPEEYSYTPEYRREMSAVLGMRKVTFWDSIAGKTRSVSEWTDPPTNISWNMGSQYETAVMSKHDAELIEAAREWTIKYIQELNSEGASEPEHGSEVCSIQESSELGTVAGDLHIGGPEPSEDDSEPP